MDQVQSADASMLHIVSSTQNPGSKDYFAYFIGEDTNLSLFDS